MLEFVNTMAMVAGYIWFFLLVVAGISMFRNRNKPQPKTPRVVVIKVEDHPYLKALREEFGGEPEPVQQQSESKITKIE